MNRGLLGSLYYEAELRGPGSLIAVVVAFGEESRVVGAYLVRVVEGGDAGGIETVRKEGISVRPD